MFIDGSVTFTNPFGEIPGELYGNIPFYFILAIFYIFTSSLWVFFCIKKWRQFNRLHFALTLLIFISLCESFLFYTNYNLYNHNGVQDALVDSLSVVIRLLRETLSRVIVLCIFMGYGTIRDTLGGNVIFLFLFGILYLIFAALSDIAKTAVIEFETSQVAWFLYVGLKLLLALMNSLFFMWVLTVMLQTIKQLRIRKQTQKLQLFNRLKWVFSFFSLFCFIFFLYELFLKKFLSQEEVDQRWQTEWILYAFWDLVYCFGIFSIAIICRPIEPFQFEHEVGFTTSEEGDGKFEAARVELPADIAKDAYNNYNNNNNRNNTGRINKIQQSTSMREVIPGNNDSSVVSPLDGVGGLEDKNNVQFASETKRKQEDFELEDEGEDDLLGVKSPMIPNKEQ